MTSKYSVKENGVNRRQFIKKAAKTAAAAVATGVWGYQFYGQNPVHRAAEKIYSLKDYRVPIPVVYPVLSIVRGSEPEKMVRASIDKLGGIEKFIKPGDKVLIKPNVAWDRQPEQAANTNPELVGAIVKMCVDARASEVRVTDGSINDPYRCFSRSGIEEAVLKAGGKIIFPDDKDLVSTDIKGDLIKVWPVFKYYHHADKVINVPIVKHHSLTLCTLSMKNWYGILGGRRNQLHQDVHTSIVDMAGAIRPTLTIMDATRVLKRNGPTGGSLSDVSIENTIIAGLDEVAIDAYSLKFLDIEVEEVPYIKMAERRGIGTSDWQSLNISEIQL